MSNILLFISTLKFTINKKKLYFVYIFSPRLLPIILYLKSYGYLTSFYIFYNKKLNQLQVMCCLFFYKHLTMPFKIKIISTPSQKIFLTHRTISIMRYLYNFNWLFFLGPNKISYPLLLMLLL